MKGKFTYVTKDPSTNITNSTGTHILPGKERHWVEDFKNTFQLMWKLYKAIRKGCLTVHFYLNKKK